MMFDPPDYPYKDLSEAYDPHNLLFNNDTDQEASGSSQHLTGQSVRPDLDNQLLFNSNESGRFFNIDCTPLSQSSNPHIQGNNEVYVVRNDSLFNYKPTLLDESTVNQFLLPVPECSKENKDQFNTAPDVLALHSCVICHGIFTTEAELLEHTVLLHASNNLEPKMNRSLPNLNNCKDVSANLEAMNEDHLTYAIEWLICRFCERVLSTALDVKPNEQLCCLDENGAESVVSRKLLTMHVCEACSGLFASAQALDTHSTICFIEIPSPCYNGTESCEVKLCSDNSEEYFSCDNCTKQYETADQLKAHGLDCQKQGGSRGGRRSYTSGGRNKMWNCGSCNQLFTTARELYRHKRGEDRPEGEPLMAYVCDECDKVLGSMCALHTHKKMHKVFKPGYPCRVCGRRFNQSGHLAIHMRMHTGERPYPCDLCTKAFKVKVERDDHRRTHTGERPFACNACPKTFTAAARLREHARIHTDQRPYRCNICGAAFRRPYARTVHTLIHTGEKPHECDICRTAFRRSGDMWKHKRTIHGSQPNAEGDPLRM